MRPKPLGLVEVSLVRGGLGELRLDAISGLKSQLSEYQELMITRPRHGGRYVVGLADGSVQQMTEAQVGQLRWDPKPEKNTTTP